MAINTVFFSWVCTEVSLFGMRGIRGVVPAGGLLMALERGCIVSEGPHGCLPPRRQKRTSVLCQRSLWLGVLSLILSVHPRILGQPGPRCERTSPLPGAKIQPRKRAIRNPGSVLHKALQTAFRPVR